MSKTETIFTYRQFVKRMTSGRGVATPDGGCPVGVALNIFRGRWKADVLYRLCAGTAGFGELQRQLPGVTRAMLASTLRDLERDGIISRKDYPVVPPKTEYALTDLGKATVPIVHAMDKWGADFFTRLGVPIPCDET